MSSLPWTKFQPPPENKISDCFWWPNWILEISKRFVAENFGLFWKQIEQGLFIRRALSLMACRDYQLSATSENKHRRLRWNRSKFSLRTSHNNKTFGKTKIGNLCSINAREKLSSMISYSINATRWSRIMIVVVEKLFSLAKTLNMRMENVFHLKTRRSGEHTFRWNAMT